MSHYISLRIFNALDPGVSKLSRNITAAATTILGPEGVSHVSEPNKPTHTAITPIIAASTAIISGLGANRRAAAAGMINNDVINNIPTIFMAIAITAAINNIKIIRARSGCKPSAAANSELTVPAKSGRHI